MGNFESSLNNLINKEEHQQNHSNARGLRKQLTDFMKKVVGTIAPVRTFIYFERGIYYRY